MTRPDYIARGGELVLSPPFAQLGTTMYSFLVGADLGALTRMVDAQLNAVSAAAGTIYKPLLPMAAIVCAQLTQGYSLTPPDSQRGWMGELDFGVWIPVIAGTMDGATWKPGRICWYQPYVFVDNVAAMATGREVYGFFKQACALAMPVSPSAPGMFTIDALVIRTFSPASQAQTLRLLTATSIEARPAPEGAWTSVRDAAEAVWSRVKRGFFDAVDATQLPITAWDAVKNLLEDLITRDVPMVFLKQFRDATVAAKACYQAVIEAPGHLDRFYAGWFTHPHEIEILDCASHPIIADCGLAGPTVRAEIGFWCRMDFTMQPGRVVAGST